VIVGGSYKALAFALDAFGNSFHEQLVSGRTASGQSIKTIFKSVEVPVSLEPDVFDVGMERSSQQLEKELHLDFARPTFRASHDTTRFMRFTQMLSDSFGVMVAMSEATAITLAAICRICSEFSLRYWIILVGGITSNWGCRHLHQKDQI